MSEKEVDPLWDASIALFEAMRDPNNPEFTNFGVLKGTLNNKPAVFICHIIKDPHGAELSLSPLFVTISPDMDMRDLSGDPPMLRQMETPSG